MVEVARFAPNAARIVAGSNPRPRANALAVSDVAGALATTLLRVEHAHLRRQVVPLLGAREVERAARVESTAIGEREPRVHVGGCRAHRLRAPGPPRCP